MSALKKYDQIKCRCMCGDAERIQTTLRRFSNEELMLLLEHLERMGAENGWLQCQR